MKRTLFTSALAVFVVLTTVRLASANCATDDPTGSKVLAAREAANSMCNCATATSHGAYVSCVAGVAKTLSSGTSPSLPKSCKGAVKKCAAHSTCGRPGTPVTCCTSSGCKIKKDAAHCPAPAVVGTCKSCCDACPAPGNGGPSCGSPSGAFLDFPASDF